MTDEIRRDLRLALLDDENDESRDGIIQLLYKQVCASFVSRLVLAQKKRGIHPDYAIPQSLEWIVFEVVIKRFNRLGSEGFTSESVEGHSISLDMDAFQEYEALIDDYFADPAEFGRSRPGRIKVY